VTTILKQTPFLFTPFHHQPTKSINMNIERMRFPSPSLSSKTTTTSSPCSTQAPTSIKDSLRSYGISEDDEIKWTDKYNRASIPLMRNDRFSKLLTEIACDTDPATVEFESKLKSVMEQKSTDSRNEFNDQACSIMLSGAALFEDSQKLEFLSILEKEHTVYGLRAFVARCLPSLIYEHPKHKPKRDSKQKKSAPPRVPKLTPESTGKTGMRRSNRINKPNTPSIGQNGRRRSGRINKPNARSGQVTFRTRLASVLTAD
jgi:hypothetical protein